ncbi:MAG: hypothetical protein JNL57_01685 [Bacteroidetes bacterium]|nr:hypothetical protein [Bacteroidota bacterium]
MNFSTRMICGPVILSIFLFLSWLFLVRWLVVPCIVILHEDALEIILKYKSPLYAPRYRIPWNYLSECGVPRRLVPNRPVANFIPQFPVLRFQLLPAEKVESEDAWALWVQLENKLSLVNQSLPDNQKIRRANRNFTPWLIWILRSGILLVLFLAALKLFGEGTAIITWWHLLILSGLCVALGIWLILRAHNQKQTDVY